MGVTGITRLCENREDLRPDENVYCSTASVIASYLLRNETYFDVPALCGVNKITKVRMVIMRLSQPFINFVLLYNKPFQNITTFVQSFVKQISIILLTCIYSLSIFGIGFKGFYCCGKLESVSLTLAGEIKATGSKDDCCKTTYQAFKLKDTHIVSHSIATVDKVLIDIIPSQYVYQAVAAISIQVDTINGSHAPPLCNGIPFYLSNCVFRI